MLTGRERLIADAVLAALLLLAPAFVLHSDSRFAGSLAGFILGAFAAALMILLLAYPMTKYSTRLKALVTRCVSMPTLLAFHAYAGIVAAFLALLHTGHKLQSPLGIALLTSMLIVVVTGFVGRYYLPQTAMELRQQQSHLATLRSAYERCAAAMSPDRDPRDGGGMHALALQDVPLLQLVDGISDLETAIGSSEAVKAIFMQWIGLHVLAAIVMYALLAVHVATEVYYGLRWLA
ncbi:iron reductase [Bradyrhizobium sp. DASA03005]|uniref:iron reductase n=1 Tax=Bradyrhizobium TaxID=374 RepID=UPI00155E7DE3|nr:MULTISPECIES: iron reductase [Bradyrhizobium]MDD1516960.1 iron reductase [Bradyrhizobium sp. WBAH30]MDD1543217.1 iron reductase [Bradyrhizobium sp. WBAH41]MDD1554862.1 iron reductase [Bradyrhizobium sp. WBAH23]MDD1562813.1 iron reductase [Bradyrhizobium sp. WBAH33]MDD1590914.1 iron reductase [Bradyrhizobium sp. WBAH42]